MGLFNKKELERIAELENENKRLKNSLNVLGGNDYFEIQKIIKQEEEKRELIQSENKLLELETEKLNSTLLDLKKKIDEINVDVEMMEFGLYKPKYDCANSQEYENKLKIIRDKQKEMIKNKTALNYSTNWTLDGSKSKGQAMNNDNMKIYLRAFNNECDVLISKVKFNNFDKIKERIYKCADTLDKLNQRNKISITNQFLNLKIDELHVVHEYNCKKQDEKEAMKAAKEAEREQAKLQKEIIEARKKIEKEQTHYENALEKLLVQLASAPEGQREDIQDKINDINSKLTDIQKNLEDIDYREANQRAGYVYVISNVGSFGEGVYKIGMTRRLEPMDRVEELGDASVPFKFDVHAMIFSDDAPKLENALHKAFENNKVNMINGRKEFFKVSLEEIEEVVKNNHDKLIEFNKYAEAQQYRESEKIKEIINNK